MEWYKTENMKQGKHSLYLYQEAAYNLQESELEDRVGMDSATSGTVSFST